ncbi:MAG: diacylglycerol kinase family protein, partial [Verrucomicrobiota bacterium]|nr:diacylglycerol kinase family protein [Verrucomicrobiota bacterium]
MPVRAVQNGVSVGCAAGVTKRRNCATARGGPPPPSGPGSATSLAAQAIRDGYKTIVASGGDGTVNEVVNGLTQARDGLGQAQLGILPLGTMNVFARELGIPLTARRAWETILLGQARAVDLPLAKVQTDAGPAERCFVQMAGAGLDGDAV